PEWLEAGEKAFADHAIGVVQGRTRVPDGVDVHALPQWALWREIEQGGPYFEACNIFYRRAALERTRGFDEVMRGWGEDTTDGGQHGWARWPTSAGAGRRSANPASSCAVSRRWRSTPPVAPATSRALSATG